MEPMDDKIRAISLTYKDEVVGLAHVSATGESSIEFFTTRHRPALLEAYNYGPQLKNYLTLCLSEPNGNETIKLDEIRNLIGIEKASSDPVNHPKHYTSHPSGVECIDIVRHMNFNLGNVVKYIWRAGIKDANVEVEDLEKALWYLRDEIRLRGGRVATDADIAKIGTFETINGKRHVWDGEYWCEVKAGE